jgi:hypothetical protein
MAEVFKARVGGEGDGVLPADAVPLIEVPPQVVDALGRGKRPPVVVTLNGYSWRSTVAVYGGQYYLPVARGNRMAAKVELGDWVEVKLELDTALREVELPPALTEALAADSDVKAAFDKLSVTTRREHAEAIISAKHEETRKRRLDRILASLRKK